MNAISETEHARLAQWFACEPLKRMGVLGFPASGQRTRPACNPASQGTDSRMCGAQTLACGGKHVHELTLITITIQGNSLVCDPALPRAEWLAIGSTSRSRGSTPSHQPPKTNTLETTILMKT